EATRFDETHRRYLRARLHRYRSLCALANRQAAAYILRVSRRLVARPARPGESHQDLQTHRDNPWLLRGTHSKSDWSFRFCRRYLLTQPARKVAWKLGRYTTRAASRYLLALEVSQTTPQ